MGILGLLAGVAGGALWAVIPAIFKAKWNTNETLFTLMMNYIAIQLVLFATTNWRGDKSSMGIINSVSKVGWLPVLGNAVVLPLIVISILTILMFFYIFKTKHGYEIQVVGGSVRTAQYSGIKVSRVLIRTLIVSGALCG